MCYADSIEISLHHVFVKHALELDKQYEDSLGNTITVNKLKYYIGNITLAYTSGLTHTDSAYHLIDLDKPESLTIALNSIPSGTINSIEFGVGVDSMSNAQGLMDGDLDPMKGMYWAWSSGFINFKLEGHYNTPKSEHELNYHIGGFMAPNETYQQVKLNMDSLALDKKNALTIAVNLAVLCKQFNVTELPKIMSPSTKAKKIAQVLPQLFRIKK